MWDGKAWDDLRFSFPDVGNRSRIVITTRLEEVAKQVKHHIDPYSLQFLTSDESLKLLQKKVFQQESFPPSLQDVSKAVAERCKGLPLVIVLVAGIIKRNIMETSWWHEVKNSLVSYHGESEGYSLSTVQLSYDNLPDHLRPCLLYMGMFLEDARIPVSELINLWIAEYFVQNIEESGRLEETAEVKGNPNRFQSSCWKDRRVSFNFTDELFSLGSKTFHQRLRSVIMTHEGDSCDRKSFSHLSDMRLVKVLYLNGPRDADICSDIFRPLIHLKYLAVDSIFNNDFLLNLPHLETLIVRKRVHGIPMEYWKMEKLRHVDIPEDINDRYNNRHEMFDESSKLENLRIFKGAVIEEADNLDVLLRKCPNLQLGISFKKAPTNDSTSGEDDYGKPFRINMESHTHLQSLRLFFPGSPVYVLQLPSNLKKLVLSMIPPDLAVYFISGLPVLEYLQLTECNIWSKEWCIPTYIKFHKLKLLKLVRLGTTTWDASEESFPQLETLVISYCDKLGEIPGSLADIPTLKQVELIGPCADSLEASAARIKEDVLDNEENDRIEIITKVS
ncbi:hypothetical protein T459_32364 [Capsicum annuum]|uniref:NB-ARC domain-containing protein n=1 Tax=Capsicum annuum TaxID=4072 RepID=A0A2G2Y262_CAPAN|nr:hypothetical protein T459_32364 [Capsicum annuum]